MSEWKSLCDMHRSICERLGNRTAIRFPSTAEDDSHCYRDLSWIDYRLHADQAASGLISLGVNPGDRIAILSENRLAWFVCDHAILSTGAANVPLHAPLAPKQVAYQVGHSEAKGIFVSNQTQADKVFAVLDQLPTLEFLVSFESINVPNNASLRAVTWRELKEAGTTPNHDEIARRESSISGSTLATIIYTSGTTGNPKGVMLSHNNLLHNAAATGEIAFIDETDTLLSWLPYSHIYARTVDHYLTTIAGATVAMARSVDTLLDDLKVVQPSWLTSVPRVYEKIWTNVATLSESERQRAIRSVFGESMKQLTSGGAPLPKYIAEGFLASGLPLLEGYGLTESSPVIAFNNKEDFRLGSVGRCIRDVQVKIADDGEILTSGPNVMQGYWKNAAATEAAIKDGWLYTGDVGRIDEAGFLWITDRKKDLFVTSAGKNIAPAELERILARDEFIDQAVVYGDGRQFVSALIVPNFERLEQLVKDQTLEIDSEGEFIATNEILAIYDSRVQAVMQQVSQPERVKRFLLLNRPFQVDDDELTATLKVRRRHIISKYENHLAKLYE